MQDAEVENTVLAREGEPLHRLFLSVIQIGCLSFEVDPSIVLEECLLLLAKTMAGSMLICPGNPTPDQNGHSPIGPTYKAILFLGKSESKISLSTYYQ